MNQSNVLTVEPVSAVFAAVRDGRSFQRINGCSLPVFRRDLDSAALFYSPGFLLAADFEKASVLDHQLSYSCPSMFEAGLLLKKAGEAQSVLAEQQLVRSFEPYCLTIYTSRNCNLHCVYCFSETGDMNMCPDLDPDAIRRAAEYVAGNCRKAGLAFTFVVHGGGEPLMDLRLPGIMADVNKIAASHGLQIFRYLATNGVMTESQAAWAADNFDQIGISCDGVPVIQDRQRPLKNGSGSAVIVERTARIIHDCGRKVCIRATITQESCQHISESIEYFCGILQANEIHIETVFTGISSETGDDYSVRDAELFCINLIAGKELAARRGIPVEFSGSRIREIHGRYCQIYRHVLQLIPGGGVSACFKTPDKENAQKLGLLVGWSEGQQWCDPQLFGQVQRILDKKDRLCENCFNSFHCARGCPDICPVTGSEDAYSFRCMVNQTLAAYELQKIAYDSLFPLFPQNRIAGVYIN